MKMYPCDKKLSVLNYTRNETVKHAVTLALSYLMDLTRDHVVIIDIQKTRRLIIVKFNFFLIMYIVRT